MSITLLFICLLVGLLIGAIGVGGVLLVPSLNYFAGISLHEAIPACMFSYLATGAVGACVFARHGSIQWKMALWVCGGAIPAAYLGALSLLYIPANIVKLLIALLMILAGLNSLLSSNKSNDGEGVAHRQLDRTALVLIGFVSGFGSAITGTGGPLILVPLIIFLGLPVLTAVGLSQVVQIPIAAFASVANWSQGSLNVTLGLWIAVAMVAGSLAGATLIHHLPVDPIKKGLSGILIVVGAAIAWQVVGL